MNAAMWFVVACLAANLVTLGLSVWAVVVSANAADTARRVSQAIEPVVKRIHADGRHRKDT